MCIRDSIYCYYVEKAVAMLSAIGSAVFLISNKWMRSDYGAGLRDFFKYHNPTAVSYTHLDVYKRQG